MTSSVTAPLERQFGQMPGLKPDVVDQFRRRLGHHVASSASNSPRRAEQEVQDRDQRRQQLPAHRSADAADLQQSQSADRTASLTFAITSKTLPLPQVEDLVDTRIAQKLSQLPGVSPGHASAAASGRRCGCRQIQRACRLRHEPRPPCAPSSAPPTSNHRQRQFRRPARASTIDANDQLKSADEYKNLIVAYQKRPAHRAYRRGRRHPTAPKNTRWGHGPTTPPRSSSMSSASPAPT